MVAVNENNELLAIKWGNSWHAHTCQCTDCLYVADAFSEAGE